MIELLWPSVLGRKISSCSNHWCNISYDKTLILGNRKPQDDATPNISSFLLNISYERNLRCNSLRNNFIIKRLKFHISSFLNASFTSGYLNSCQEPFGLKGNTGNKGKTTGYVTRIFSLNWNENQKSRNTQAGYHERNWTSMQKVNNIN